MPRPRGWVSRLQMGTSDMAGDVTGDPEKARAGPGRQGREWQRTGFWLGRPPPPHPAPPRARCGDSRGVWAPPRRKVAEAAPQLHHAWSPAWACWRPRDSGTRWPCSLAGQLPDVQCAHQGGGAPAGAGAGKLCRRAGRPGDGAGSCHTLDAGALVSGASGRRPDAASRKQVPPREALPWRGRGGSGPWTSARRNHVGAGLGDPGDLSALSRGHAAGSGSLARPRALPPQAVCVCPATEQLGRAAAVRPGPGGKAPLRFRRAEWSHVPRSCFRGS